MVQLKMKSRPKERNLLKILPQITQSITHFFYRFTGLVIFEFLPLHALFSSCILYIFGSHSFSSFFQIIASQLGCEPDDIYDFELQACDTQPSIVAGAAKEFIFSGRLDNLCMSFCSLKV